MNPLQPVLRTRRRRQRGQTAVVALLVLLLLAFVGALFITIVARNLVTQGRTHRTLNADYYAEAGLRYADDQLTSSLDGADWRPPLQAQLADGTAATNTLGVYAAGQDPVSLLIGPTTSTAYSRYKAAGLPAPDQNDPDLAYLRQGFARYTTANGRFLLRVTYDPARQSSTNTPTARYLKIESIGREGTVDPTDPTTFGNQPVTRLAATLVAYKPIGITDYARFETNIDNRSGTMNLGVPSLFHTNGGSSDPTATGVVTPGVFDFSGSTTPSLPQYPIITTYGSPTGGPGGVPGGGSFFANANVRFYGVNDFYLASGAQSDDISVAGNIFLDSYDPTVDSYNAATPNVGLDKQQAAVILNPQSADLYIGPTTSSVRPFDTHNGQVRDAGSGSSASDAEGNPRSVARLDPPVIDTANSATSLTRYQAITENAPPRIDPATMSATAPLNDPSGTGTPYPTANAALYGYGQAVYINNPTDIQRDSTSLVGGHTLVDEWLNSNPGGQAPTATKGGWVGPFYNPPGAEIAFGVQTQTYGTGVTAKTLSKYGFRITRSDVDSAGNPALWTDSTGKNTTGRTLTVTYDEMDASNDLTTVPASGGALAAYRANPNNDVIIYAEGNVRVRGILSAATPISPATNDDSRPRHVTVITNGTAYIDGNVIKGNPDSSITIMARDYVCINTTQFLAGASDTYPGVNDGQLDFAQDSDLLVQEFTFGVTPSVYPGASPSGATAPTSPLALYVSGGAGASGSVIADFDIINPFGTPTALGQPPSITGPANNPFDAPIVGPPATGLFDSTTGTGPSLVTHRTYDLYGLLGTANYPTLLNATTQQPFQLWTRRDSGADNSTATVADQPFQLERAAILPMDVRIEAVLYAQNKSFFVIPGPWFNSDTSDTTDAYVGSKDSNNLYYRLGVLNSDPNLARFPFYGQPLDLKITIAGAVSEARPADISAQAAWMQKWGWIPQYHGSQTFTVTGGASTPHFETAGHPPVNGIPATGLTFVYDPLDGYPAASGDYLRTDLYGRPLPITPKLPVSTGLLYSGQNPGPSLLQ